MINQEVRIFNRQDAKEAIVQAGRLPQYEVDVNFVDYERESTAYQTIFLPTTSCDNLVIVNKQLNLLTAWMARNALIDLKEFEKQNRIKGNYFEFLNAKDPNAELIKSILLGVTDGYSHINNIPEVCDIILSNVNDESYEEGSYGVHNPDNSTISIYLPAAIGDFALKDGINSLLETTIHEWLHHWFAILLQEQKLLDLSFLIDRYHSQQFVALEKFVGISNVETIKKQPKSVRIHNSFITGILEEVGRKTTQETNLAKSLPEQMIYEGCPNF